MLERDFQSRVIKQLSKILTDSLIIKLDPGYIQGIPDLLILREDKWAALETKQTSNSKYRPNQRYYLDKMNQMSFARSINQENEDLIYAQVERALRLERISRVLKSE